MLTLILALLNPDKTARRESISRLRSSAFVQNEYFGKICRELRSERRQQNKTSCLAVLLGLGEGLG
jgi:hypothetical protein